MRGSFKTTVFTIGVTNAFDGQPVNNVTFESFIDSGISRAVTVFWGRGVFFAAWGGGAFLGQLGGRRFVRQGRFWSSFAAGVFGERPFLGQIGSQCMR